MKQSLTPVATYLAWNDDFYLSKPLCKIPVKHIMSSDVSYRHLNCLSLLKKTLFLCNTLQRLHGAWIRNCATGFLRKCTTGEAVIGRCLSFETFFWTCTAPLRRIHCSVE